MSPIYRRFKALLFSPTSIFLILGLAAGILFCVFIPFNAGFDEETHLTRIWDIAHKNWIPNQSWKNGTTLTPGEFFFLSYQRRYFQTPADDLFSPDVFNRKINPDDFVAVTTRSSYPPLVYLPQAVVVNRLGVVNRWPIIPVEIFSRIAGMLAYIAGSAAAIRLLPTGKWLMVVLALGPTALFQAATLNGDGITTAISFLFISMTLNVYARRPGPITGWQTLFLAALLVALGAAKQGALVLLPLLFLLPPRRFQPRVWFFILWAAAALAVVIMVGWNVLVLPRAGIEVIDGQSISRQLQLILVNWLDALRMLVVGFIGGLGKYYLDWVGAYGHWVGAVPGILYWIYPLAAAAAIVSESPIPGFTRSGRWFMLACFFMAVGGLCVLFSYLYYRPGLSQLIGMQGRYLTPLMPLLLIPLVGLLWPGERLARAARIGAGLLAFLSVAVFAYGMYASYYTYCGTALYTGGTCTQPVYKNLDKTNAPSVAVTREVDIRQTFLTVCGNLSNVQVYVKSLASDPSQTIRFSLVDEKGQILATDELFARDIPSNSYLGLPIKPPTGEAGKLYEIRIEASAAASGSGPLIAISTEKQVRDGQLWVGGKEKQADLIFRYTCRIGP